MRCDLTGARSPQKDWGEVTQEQHVEVEVHRLLIIDAQPPPKAGADHSAFPLPHRAGWLPLRCKSAHEPLAQKPSIDQHMRLISGLPGWLACLNIARHR